MLKGLPHQAACDGLVESRFLFRLLLRTNGEDPDMKRGSSLKVFFEATKKVFSRFIACDIPMWGCSSAGRALEWHSRGREFDPRQLHHTNQENITIHVPPF